MREILFIRHGESEANVRDLAVGNREASLTRRGIAQALDLRRRLIVGHGIIPELYGLPVAASWHARTFETAWRAGFRFIDRHEILDESEIYNRGELAGVDVVAKHVNEGGWIPEEEVARSRQIIEGCRNGALPYGIIFCHGMVMAGVEAELNNRGANYPFDPVRGLIPLQTDIVSVSL